MSKLKLHAYEQGDASRKPICGASASITSPGYRTVRRDSFLALRGALARDRCKNCQKAVEGAQ